MDNELTKYNSNIIEQVKGIAGEDADDLAVMQYLAQVAATANLVKINRREDLAIPIGSRSYVIAVTDVMTEFRIANPWISFSLINDGPDNILFKIDKLEGGITEEAPINNTETVSLDFRFPIVNILYLVTQVAGTVASVRVYAVEGKKWG